MSRIQLILRPWAEFDPKNSDHRKWYNDYLKKGNWGSCPVRFIDPNECSNLAFAMQRTLLEYYSNQEFNKKK